jgi:Asp-tRNA(Asn)/Glu-tRNA(Gln) amidotransferase B subunit
LFEASAVKLGLDDLKCSPEEIANVIKMVNADELSSTNSKLVIEKLVFE